MLSNKGQSMSINVIIVAVLALLILVILGAIFTGRIAIFNQGVGAQGNVDLAEMKISYGSCKPTVARESTYTTEYSQAATPEDKEVAQSRFRDEISRCKSWNDDKTNCEANGCRY
ncbi:hypothetical protein HYV86_05975 [Candidatus Woesearchaeota archaeon]|nr:hypothetical protein [Candidatus Woesearchaeota archaeon]